MRYLVQTLIFLGMTSHLFAATIIFNDDWQFRKSSASNWETVILPHTANVEPYVSNDMWMGVARYRKEFAYDQSWVGKRVFVEFEGAMTVAKVSLNGKLLTTHHGGYMGFVVDVTESLKATGGNILEVELDNRENPDVPPGKSYKTLDFAWFSGLYRNVKLHVKAPLHITHPLVANVPAGGGVFVTYPKITKNEAVVAVKTHVKNTLAETKQCVVRQELIYENISIAKVNGELQITADDATSITQQFTVETPQLWSPQSPALYELKTTILLDGKVVDSLTQRIGLRSVSVTSEGFLINGEKMFLRGTNRHQEYPYVGYAASDHAQYRDAQLIKEAGYDLVRLSHYPHSPAFYRACDELGILLIDCITGWQYFKSGDFEQRSLQEAREMIRRDRNHPSVVMWETSLNESGMPDAFRRKLHEIVDEEYPGDQSISLSYKFGDHDVFAPARQHGKGPEFWDRWENDGKPLFTAEYGDWEYYANAAANFNQTGAKELKKDERTSRQTRGHGEKRLLQMALNYQESHNQNLRGKSIIGDANWLAIDYNRGYAPDHCTSGVMDLMRLPKFAYYFYKSQRPATEQSALYDSGSMVFAATYWNKDSNPKVRVFSNCEEVAVSLNGKQISRQKPDTDMFCTHLNHPPFTFDLGEFVPGELIVTGFIAGKEAASHTVRTPGKGVGLRLFVHEGAKPLQGDESDFTFVFAAVVDAKGTVVPDSTNSLNFEVSGAKIIGPQSVAAEAGINGVLVGQTKAKSNVVVKVKSPGLEADRMEIVVE